MPGIQAAALAMVARLQAAGIAASVDERDLNPPAVLVAVPGVAYQFGKGTADYAFTLAAVVANSGRATALANLSDLVDQVVAALPDCPPVAARAIDLIVPDQGAPLPGYELTLTQRIKEK